MTTGSLSEYSQHSLYDSISVLQPFVSSKIRPLMIQIVLDSNMSWSFLQVIVHGRPMVGYPLCPVPDVRPISFKIILHMMSARLTDHLFSWSRPWNHMKLTQATKTGTQNDMSYVVWCRSMSNPDSAVSQSGSWGWKVPQGLDFRRLSVHPRCCPITDKLCPVAEICRTKALWVAMVTKVRWDLEQHQQGNAASLHSCDGWHWQTTESHLHPDCSDVGSQSFNTSSWDLIATQAVAPPDMLPVE